METTKKCKPSDWMKTQMNNSFSDALGCSSDVTEEEQDEFLYDGDVEITHKYNNNSHHLNDSICTEDISGILNLMCSEDNKYTTANYAAHPQPEEFSSQHGSTKGTMVVSTEMPGSEASFKKEFPVGSSRKPDSKEHLTTSKMSDVLLHHFSEVELLSTCQLIECEMIPESSFTDSIDDTGSEPEPSEHLRGPSVQEQWATTFEEYHLEKHKEVNSSGENENMLSENRPVSKKPCTGKCGCTQENSQLINENEHTHTFQNMKDERGLFKKTVSPCKLQYSQGQAHCCLPDFYEVASEVKVPKRTDNINSVPTTGRAKPFPILLSKSVSVNNMLENKNYFNSAEVENKEEMSISELLQQLKMLTQHADTQNHIDHLRFNPKILPQSDFPNASTAISSGGTGTAPGIIILDAPIPVQSTHGLLKARLQSGTAASALPAAGMVEARCPNPSNSLPELTLGEKMSQILKDQTEQLTKKVEDFSKHMSQETFFLQDKYLALNQLKRYLDALERNYLTAREKHHNLQLQNFKDKSINIGEFDPDRRVEGGIFRLGMLLEDIQEQMDHSKHSLSSLLTSYESAYSSHSFCEGSVVSSIADPPERRGTETPFLYKNHEGEKSPTTDVIPQTKQLYLEGKNCCLCPHRNINIQERKTGTSSLFSQRKPTDLSDTYLSSDSEDISVYDSYNDSQSKDLVNCDTQNYQSLNTRLCGERKGLGCRCPRGSRDQVKLRNFKESVQSCALCRNKSSGSSSYSQKRISTKNAQKNQQPHELVNRLSERESFEAAKTCCSSTCNKILVSHQYIPSKKFAQSKSAIRNASDSNANILSSTLDHAIQTANSLKKTTERMVRAVSEDLAKVKRKPL
ncbi:PREDICTED: protein AKNAD1 isoform X1 [Lepidothrix coronata]|uniref:Protein AKNAD1 isoform X1 n=1 Tax=Lepidothrix coronata TaxID=321398 RepID=A0A6J0IQP5_9PASS|nr:PREDICTED: protein AKNAD1 isoform X1 [Lepidothrix coronata]XP_017688369.1 PREDICTED: protein AKNAD1 isoform X1 [Lepidothrix coronata]